MKRSAFTLVELLVVIAIIGLLSTVALVSLNASRAAARDAKRKADLHQISQAVELFINANGYSPTRPWITWCTYIHNPTYTNFVSNLAPYMPNIPADPSVPKQAGDYLFRDIDGYNKYGLCVNLEKETGNSYDYSTCAGGVVYNYCIYPNGT